MNVFFTTFEKDLRLLVCFVFSGGFCHLVIYFISLKSVRESYPEERGKAEEKQLRCSNSEPL